MSAADALAVLSLLGAAGLDPWVDGGWGVDALLGTETRRHGDLDLVLPVDDVDAALHTLHDEGFALVRDLRPTAYAVGHPDGREVDLHPVVPRPDGGGEQDLSGDPALAGRRFSYGPPVDGSIAGTSVRCVDPVTQLAAHRGYPPRRIDLQDVRALADRFGLPLPPEHAVHGPPG